MDHRDATGRAGSAVVAVAGGTAGIGLCTARAFARDGWSTAVCGRSADTAQRGAQALRHLDPVAQVAVVDVTDREQLHKWLDSIVDDLGRLDVIVANAGGNSTPDDWSSVYRDNVEWVADLVDWAATHLEAGASVVVLSSVAARVPLDDPSTWAYSGAKAALERSVGLFARRLGARGVRLNAVSPGPVEAPGGFWEDQRRDHPEFVRSLEASSALGRLVTADEVAACVRFLAGPDAAGITGTVLRCDAGLEGRLP
jgi:NAD(P)-dependent dehydrogenase (short-subunit alcohol dehydrogenase family)